MRIADGTWSVVLVGKWNRYLLPPEWVGRNIFHEKEGFEVQFPVNRPDLAPRYRSSQNIFFMPSVHRCQFLAQPPYNDEMLTHICVLVRSLTEILQHTPVSGMGINYGFEEASDNFNFLSLFQLEESDRFSGLGHSLNSTEIKREFMINDTKLNLTVSHSQDIVSFDFNFHYDTNTSEEIAAIIVDDLLIRNRDTALNIMENIYDLQLESEEEDL